jgi:hypothetical protein
VGLFTPLSLELVNQKKSEPKLLGLFAYIPRLSLVHKFLLVKFNDFVKISEEEIYDNVRERLYQCPQ